MDSVTLFTTNATLVYFGEPKPEVEEQAKKLYRLAKDEIAEWVRGELLNACQTPGVNGLDVSLCLPACNEKIRVSVDTSSACSIGDDGDLFSMQTPRMYNGRFIGSPYSDYNYITPIGRMPHFLYRKIISEETPVSRLFAFLASEYKKLTDEVKTTIPSEQDMEAVFAHDILYLHRFGSIIQAFEAMRGAKVA